MKWIPAFAGMTEKNRPLDCAQGDNVVDSCTLGIAQSGFRRNDNQNPLQCNKTSCGASKRTHCNAIKPLAVQGANMVMFLDFVVAKSSLRPYNPCFTADVSLRLRSKNRY